MIATKAREPAIAPGNRPGSPGGRARKDLRAIVAPTLAALAGRAFNNRHYRLARWLVECTLARGQNFVYAPTLEFVAGPLGFGRSEVHELLFGYKNAAGQRVAGLAEVGFVRVREAALDKGWLLTVCPEPSRWDVPAIYTEASHAKALADVDAVRNTFASQMESGEIAEWFPDLTAVLDEVALENALAAANAQPEPPQPLNERDALERFNGVEARSCRPSCSNSLNKESGEFRGKPGDVQIVRTHLRLKKDLSPRLKINLKPCQGEELKDALAKLQSTQSDDEVRQALDSILGKNVAANDAGKWINRHRIHREKVFTIMAAVVERISQQNLPAVARVGGLAETYWKNF